MGRRWDCSCVRLTVDYRDLPGAAAHTAEAPIAPTQGGVGKLPAAAAASAITTFDRGNRAGTIEHGFDGSPTDRLRTVAFGRRAAWLLRSQEFRGPPCSGRSARERFLAVRLRSYARGVSRIMDAMLREGDPRRWTDLDPRRVTAATRIPGTGRFSHQAGQRRTCRRYGSGPFSDRATTCTRIRGCRATMSP